MTSVILACPTLRRELLCAIEQCGATMPVYFLPRRLHNDPKELHEYLQMMIDSFANVQRIYICVSGCGGGTAGLLANGAELVIPRSRDCLDILLSGDSLSDVKRNIRGVFFTESWMEFSKNSDIDLDRLTAKLGREKAERYLRGLYKTFNEFYIIDTGCYDIRKVEDYVAPLVRILEGSVTVVPGGFGILRKIAAGVVDDDFIVVPPGGKVPGDRFLKNC